MGFCEVLTIVFVVLKLIGVISWSWWVVFSPELIGLGVGIIIGLILRFVNRYWY